MNRWDLVQLAEQIALLEVEKSPTCHGFIVLPKPSRTARLPPPLRSINLINSLFYEKIRGKR